MVVDIPDVITSANFGEDRLRGLGVAGGGQNLPFSIDFDRCPYNTLALPCECVISNIRKSVISSAVSARLASVRFGTWYSTDQLKYPRSVDLAILLLFRAFFRPVICLTATHRSLTLVFGLM